MEVKLVVEEGKAKGKVIPLPSSQFIIGRSSRCHLRPHSDQVSKVHCAIGRKAGNRIVVRDMKSRNKTYVNGEPISGDVTVQDGDLLGVGPLTFRFVIDPETSDKPIKEDHILWLMDNSADSFDVESSADTTLIELPPDLLDENEADDTGEDHGLSAGQYLRDQVQRSEAPAEPAPAASDAGVAAAGKLLQVQLEPAQLVFLDQLAAGMRKEFSTAVPTRDEIARTLIDGIMALNLEPSAIHSLQDLKAAIAAFRQ